MPGTLNIGSRGPGQTTLITVGFDPKEVFHLRGLDGIEEGSRLTDLECQQRCGFEAAFNAQIESTALVWI